MVTPRRKLGKKVAPLRSADIRNSAQKFRDMIGLKGPFVNVIGVLEALQGVEFLEFEVVEDYELGDEEAVTRPDQSYMQIKQSVYDSAHAGDGHCRFTIAHELGHLVMHTGQSSYARGSSGSHRIFEDSEWQADTFASEFLIDQRLIPANADEYDISSIFGVSHSAARHRLNKFKKGA